ncbi:MAG: hypothetical protein Q9222_006238 [Ikaeria aurantiellina]
MRAIIFVSILHGAAMVAAQACAAGTAKELGGNWYCSEVKAITYSNFPGTGSYNKIANMDPATGKCTTEKHTYSGSLAPLSEELSMHFRGPTWLKQLAVYYPDGGSPVKRSSPVNPHAHHHAHQHLHHAKRDHVVAARSVGQMVTATIDGKVVNWVNQYAGPGASPNTAAAQPASAVQTTLSTSVGAPPQASTPSTSGDSSAGSGSGDSSNAGSGSWSRQAYYNADAGSSDGFTFLNHFGGTQGMPGTADGGPAFGASLSYASSDGKSAAASPQILQNKMIEDDVEMIVMSNKTCDGGSCGYTRPGGVAYREYKPTDRNHTALVFESSTLRCGCTHTSPGNHHAYSNLSLDGFSGDHKLFMMEFSMPATGKKGFNADMPGIWLLNAQIPLTSQYGTNPECSCWTSGCGEFDLFEILDSGNFRCKSTLHMAPAGGSSDYFQRPEKSTIKAAVLFTGSNESAHIKVLDDSQSFDESLAADVINAMTADSGSGGASSVFRLTT